MSNNRLNIDLHGVTFAVDKGASLMERQIRWDKSIQPFYKKNIDDVDVQITLGERESGDLRIDGELQEESDGWQFYHSDQTGWDCIKKRSKPLEELEGEQDHSPYSSRLKITNDMKNVEAYFHVHDRHKHTACGWRNMDLLFLSLYFPFRKRLLFHSSAVSLDGNGYLFIGESGSGKSTIARQFQDAGAIVLSDERNVTYVENGQPFVHGTWLHSDFLANSDLLVPLKGIFLLNQAEENQVVRIASLQEKYFHLLRFVTRQLTPPYWWENTLAQIERLNLFASMYNLSFDLSGAIVTEVRKLT